MSRAHMLYDNKPLESVAVTVRKWKSKWNPDEIFRFQEGTGVLLEGKLHDRSRFSITDELSGTNKWRYVALHVEITRAYKRKFDSSGKEIEPNFGVTKKVATGYLMSLYTPIATAYKHNKLSKGRSDVVLIGFNLKTCAAGDTDRLSPDQVKQLTRIPNIEELTEEKTQKFKSCVAFWCEEKDLDSIELFPGDHLRLKTKGSGPFIEFITKVDDESSTVSNYTGGEPAGASWTEKVMSFKGSQPLPQDQQEGVDEDEWDD